MSLLQSYRCRSGWTLCALLTIGCWLVHDPSSVHGNQPDEAVTVGIEGHYRVGRWTGIRYRGGATVASIETRDGDGCRLEYQQGNDRGDSDWNYAVAGSEAAPLILRSETEALLSTRFPTTGSPSRGAAMIPLGMPWIVALGDPLGVHQIGANELLGRDAQIAVSRPADAAAIPDSSLGFDGVDMMILGGSSARLLATLDGKQRAAIRGWLTDGGRLLLTLGESSPELLEAAPWLQSLLPIDELTTIKIDPAAIETFTSTQTPLQPFVGAKLPKNKGRILIMGRTTRRISTPVAAQYNVGFGRITVIAADLEDEMFAAWPERLDLITQLTGSILILDQQQATRKSRATAYDDLAGQLRATLDQFANRRNFGFSIVSLILMALIAAIGPLDYLLVNRVLGRPLLGWLSFPIVVIGLSVLLALQAKPTSHAGSQAGQGPTSDQLSCNRIEIIDVDAINSIGRGFTANYLYAHDATQFDLHVTASPSLGSIAGQVDTILATPLGYPGESYGGIQIAIEDSRLPKYQVPLDQARSSAGTLNGLPLASRSSKGIATRIEFNPELAAEISMGHRAGSELLQGELTNPLPFDLLDGMLVYRNWAYLLPTRFPAGDRIARVDSLRQKNFRWQLSRQMALESATETEAWNPARIDSPQRISEMLMFHNAVGGSRYTSMHSEPLSFLDLSHVLAGDRCMLIGRIEEPFTQLEAKGAGAAREPVGQILSLIRVVLPVDSERR